MGKKLPPVKKWSVFLKSYSAEKAEKKEMVLWIDARSALRAASLVMWMHNVPDHEVTEVIVAEEGRKA